MNFQNFRRFAALRITNATYFNSVQNSAIIERVQRRFTKRVSGLSHYSYADRLKSLGIDSLQLRRLKIDLCFLYKVINGYYGVRLNRLLFTLPIRSYNTRTANTLNLSVPKYDKTYRLKSFNVRIVSLWNSIKPYVQKARSPKMFSYLLDTDPSTVEFLETACTSLSANAMH